MLYIERIININCNYMYIIIYIVVNLKFIYMLVLLDRLELLKI